jgi:hypothetical protein
MQIKDVFIMIKRVITLGLFTIFFAVSADAQVIDIAAIIKAAVDKVIKAVDLEIQRWQTQTIELQNAQKILENAMSQAELDSITNWVQQQQALYQEYYNELWQVKHVIADYNKVKSIVGLQEKILSEYHSAYALFKQDKNFTAGELSYMYNVYSGILSESSKNVSQLLLVVNAFVTQMTDEQRLQIIDNAAVNMQKNYNDLKLFNNQSIQLSLQRATENNDVETVKQLYGLQ